MKKIVISIYTSLALVFCTPYITQASPLVYATERIAGQDRVATALEISQKGWDSAQTVILCEYSDYADSIASTPYAVSLNAPILLTKGDAIDPRVKAELERLNPQNIILLGGPSCLKPSIETELNKLSLSWERIGGVDRYETSVLLAKKISSDSLILANGNDFPDALSAATFAGIKQIPIVLTSTTLPGSVIQYYEETEPKHLIVIGGESVVPSDVLMNNNFTIETRLGGLNRYETNAKVVSFMKDTYESNDLFLASGVTFPDAVAGTVLASKFKAPLLLTQQTDIPPSVYSLMREHMKIEPPSKNSSDNDQLDLQKGIITASGGLNLRETPSTTGNPLATIPKDTTIDLIEQQGQWYKTTYDSKTGWISANFVTKSTEPQIGQINASGGLNLRETPSSTGNPLTTIPNGTTVDLIVQQDQWYKTTYNSITGWISADYVIKPKDNSTLPIEFDSSANGKVYLLGGPSVISSNSQKIIEGKASSSYQDNLKDFPPLPSEIKKPVPPPSRGDDDDVIIPPEDPTSPDEDPTSPETYDPSSEVLLNPFKGIPANALLNKTIFLDPGHGGPDTGAIGPTHTYEKANNLAIALELNDILQQAGAKVLFTRDNDTSPAANYTEANDLEARVELANQSGADLFISIHNDSFSRSEVEGSSTYYSKDNVMHNESLQLANSIQFAVIDTLKTQNRGLKEAGFYVLRKTTMPSVLLETAFISNPYEEARLQNPTFRKNVATAIFHGIYNYYKNPLPQD